MKEKKTVRYEDLVDALSFSHLTQIRENERAEQFFIENQQFYSETKNGITFNHDAYIRRLNSKLDTLGLKDHVIITGDCETYVPETDYSHRSSNAIIVKDLVILVSKSCGAHMFTFDQFNFHVTFFNNEFISTEEEYLPWVQFLLSENAYLVVESNVFIGVDVYAGGRFVGPYHLRLKKNIFSNRHVSIGTIPVPSDNDTNCKYLGFHISGSDTYRQRIAKDFEQKEVNKDAFSKLSSFSKKVEDNEDISLNDIIIALYEMFNWVSIDPEKMIPDTPQREASVCIMLSDNKFNQLNVGGTGYLFLKGNNEIRYLKNCGMSPYCYFGPYQKIDPMGEYAEQHKEIFLKLQEKAIENNDQSQINILQLEIKKCEHQILKKEKRSLANIQDLFIYSWGACISGHSTSWIKPIEWLFGINAFFTILIFWCYYGCVDCSTLATIFWEFFNPVSSPKELLSSCVSKITWHLSLLNVVQKIILGVLAYEIIKAFRRFTIKL